MICKVQRAEVPSPSMSQSNTNIVFSSDHNSQERSFLIRTMSTSLTVKAQGNFIEFILFIHLQTIPIT